MITCCLLIRKKKNMDDKYAQYKRLNEIEHLDPKGFNLTGTQYFLIYMNQLNLSS